MCELLGLCYRRPVHPTFTLRGFRSRGRANPDGWGLGFYPDDRAAQVLKEPRQSTESELSGFLAEYPLLAGRVIISHVRRATRGELAHVNTHPFEREIGGRELLFAHNGTVTDLDGLPLGRFRPLGDTDSEHVFCHLLAGLEETGRATWDEAAFGWLHARLRRINERGTLNVLLSDGDWLAAYHDRTGHVGLHLLDRSDEPSERRMAEDPDLEVAVDERGTVGQTGCVVASRPLSDEAWEPIEPGGMVVLRDGDVHLRRPAED